MTAFHRHLKRRDLYAEASSRWRDPRAQLLDGPDWEQAKDRVLAALRLGEDPEPLLARHAATLDLALRDVAVAMADEDSGLSVDGQGLLHVAALKAIPEPITLVDLRRRVAGMVPHVDLPEVLLEVTDRVKGFGEAFTLVSGGRTRLKGLQVSVAACLTAQGLNIGYRPVIKTGVEELERSRLSHVAQQYLGIDAYRPANATLIAAQSRVPFAQVLGGGMVAAIDGMRFVVPVKSIYARPNRKYFGPKRGITWLNMINDQAIGTGALVVTGTLRDTLNMVDVLYRRDGGPPPEIVITDTGSYSDIVFGLLNLLGMHYRPVLADMPDQKGWRIDRQADYGPLATFARGKIDLDKIRKHWPDILRVVGSIHTGEVRAHDVMKMLQRDGRPTPLGDAFAHYGRIFKTLHILAYSIEEPYRRDIKRLRNLQEGRHGLAEKIFHGKKGRLHQKYFKGMEDQLGALGLVLNCVVLWNTWYIDKALDQLRAQGYPVFDEDVARLSPFIRDHLNVDGTYNFLLPDLGPTGWRELRDPDAGHDEDHDFF
ncbi:transposase [Nonomuraea sp. NPDC055795]